MEELQILESKETRNELMERIDVLEKVKQLVLLPNDLGATTQMVADYFEVSLSAIKKCVQNNKSELESNGLINKTKEILLGENVPIKTKRGGFDILDDNDNVIATGSNKGITLFTRRAILNVAMLLRDSKVADQIKIELGLPTGSNISYRKEKIFEDNLKLMLQEIENELFIEGYNSAIIDRNKALKNILKYETQYNVCNGKYRIDFYFPYLNFAVEYDEKYHESEQKKWKDSEREYKIMRDIYIHKYYKENELEEYNKLLGDEYKPFSSVEEIFEEEYKEDWLEYGFDLTRFFRIKENNEMMTLIKLCSAITNKTKELLDSCGMSCDYSEFLR